MKFYLSMNSYLSRFAWLGIPPGGWLCFLLLGAIRVWMVSGQEVFAIGGNIHDDMLFLNLANSLVAGEWLGPYNQITLIKGPVYPLWIALIYFLGLPLLLAQHLLYVASCIVFCISVKPLLRKNSLLIPLYALLLFNPMSFVDGPMTRILREGIYPALTLFVVASVIALLLRHQQPIRTLIPWSIGLGISLSAFWLIREDSIWLIPAVVTTLAFSVWKIPTEGGKYWTKVFMFVFPFLFMFVSIGTVSSINRAYYGTSSVIGIKSEEFQSAYGALTRVKHETWQPVFPVTREVREKIYEVSPAFNELRPFFVADIGGWGSTIENINAGMRTDLQLAETMNAIFRRDGSGIWEETFNAEQSELLGAVFIWTLRYAVAAAGYHTSADTAGEYYSRLSSEINQACEDGKLDCIGERSALAPPLHIGYAYPLFRTLIDSLVYLVTFDEFKADVSISSGSEESLDIYRKLTNEDISALDQASLAQSRSSRDNVKLSMMESIAKVYQLSMPLLFFISLVVYFITSLRNFNNRSIELFWVVTTLVLLSIILRAGVLSMVHITSFPTINLIYLSPSYPLVLIFSALSMIHYYQEFQKTKSKAAANQEG